MIRSLICTLLLLGTGYALYAQLPQTQVFVFDIDQRDTAVTFANPQYLTAFNRNGYNNQPNWIDRNNLLLSVQLPDMQQPDIFSFDLAGRTRLRMTRTVSGEFSPKAMGDGRKFSAVRQEYVGQDTVLRLWEFPTNLTDNGRPVFKYINGIGYYEWLNSAQLALFLVGEQNTLAIAAAETDNPRTLATNVGRCFTRLPNGNLAYVDKSTPTWNLVEKNLYRMNEPARMITPTLTGSEDFTVLADGSYLMGRGSKVYRFDPIRNPRWIEVVDLRFYGIKNISRLAFNGVGKLALVAETT